MRVRRSVVTSNPYFVRALAIVLLLAVPATGWAAQVAAQQEESLSLSLADALRMALEKNLDIAVVNYDRHIAEEAITTAKGAFDALFLIGIPGAVSVVGGGGGGFGQTAVGVGGFGFAGSETPSTSALTGAKVNESGSYTTQSRLQHQLDFGFYYEVGYDVGRSTSNNLFTNLNPAWNNSLGFVANMPLLKGRGKEATGAPVLLAERNAEVSAEVFRTQVNTILFSVVQSYWELVFAERNLEVAEASLQLAQDQLERTQAQVEVGMLAPVEETQAEVAVAQRRNELIIARNGLENSKDNLRALLKADTLSGGWDTALEATEAPEVTPQPADINEAIQAAIAHRPEIATARAQIAARQVDVDATHNALLPSLDFVGGFSFNGIGGNEILTEGFPPVVIGEVPGGYSDAVRQLFGLDFGSWRVGLNFSIPIGNNRAKGNYATATLAEDKARTELQRAEQQAVLEVRRAVRAVTDAGELVTSTRATRELAEQQLSIEQDRFDVGMSTNFEVLSFQDDLSRAQVQELRAMIDYRNSQAALARVTGTIAESYGIQIR